MRQFTISGNSSAVGANAYANDVVMVNGTAVTLLATVPGDSLGHKIVVTNNSATDYSAGGKALAIVGTDPDGNPQTESLTGPAGSTTSTSTKYWGSMTSITPNFSTGADTFDIGFAAASATPWTWLDPDVGVKDFPAAGIGLVGVVDSGSPTFTVQYTLDGGVNAHNHATIAAKTATTDGSQTTPVQGLRLIFTAAGQVTLHGQM